MIHYLLNLGKWALTGNFPLLDLVQLGVFQNKFLVAAGGVTAAIGINFRKALQTSLRSLPGLSIIYLAIQIEYWMDGVTRLVVTKYII